MHQHAYSSCLVGQIAALTGTESGKKSPLATEMCAYNPPSRSTTYLLTSSQRSVRHDGVGHRYCICHRILRCWDHDCIQGQRGANRHVRSLDPRGFRSRRSTIGCHTSVSHRRVCVILRVFLTHTYCSGFLSLQSVWRLRMSSSKICRGSRRLVSLTIFCTATHTDTILGSVS